MKMRNVAISRTPNIAHSVPAASADASRLCMSMSARRSIGDGGPRAGARARASRAAGRNIASGHGATRRRQEGGLSGRVSGFSDYRRAYNVSLRRGVYQRRQYHLAICQPRARA